MSTLSFDDLCKGLESQIEKLGRRKRLSRAERHRLADLEIRLTNLEAPAPAVPALRLSIRKDGERWVLTTVRDEHRNESTCDDTYELYRLMDDMLAGHTCHLCGAPLWQTDTGFVVCSRHWGHYPQPNAGDYCETHGWHTTTPPKGGFLPSIKRGHLPPATSHPANLSAWVKAHLEVETTEERFDTEDGERVKTFTRYTMRTPTKAQRTRQGNKLRKDMAIRWAQVPPGSVGDRLEKKHNGNGHVPPELSVRYADYVHLMTDNKIQPRTFTDWEVATRAARARQMQTA